MGSFNNEINAFFAVFMSLWGKYFRKLFRLGTVFYQIWRRNNAVLAYQWDCEDFNEVEPDRPEFKGTRVHVVSDLWGCSFLFSWKRTIRFVWLFFGLLGGGLDYV